MTQTAAIAVLGGCVSELDAASMRRIAAEAGVSLRVVQYHFDSKHALLAHALRLLYEENERPARARIRSGTTDPRRLLRALLGEFLPLDEQRASALRVFAAYYARSLTDPWLAAVFLAAEQPLEALVADIIGMGQAAGRTTRASTHDTRRTCWLRGPRAWAWTSCTSAARRRTCGRYWTTTCPASSRRPPLRDGEEGFCEMERHSVRSW